jgi:cytochrome c oxidase cbb3-type subunit 3
MKNTKYIFCFLLVLVSLSGFAQENEVVPTMVRNTSFLDWVLENILVVTGIIMIGLAMMVISRTMSVLMELQKIRFIEEHGLKAAKEANIMAEKSFWSKFYRASTDLIPIEKEQDIDLGHDYDGIRELDNSMPPWWVWMFYATIAYAGVYMYWYHFSDNGTNMINQYAAEMEEGDRIKQAFLDKMADAINEKDVVALTDQTDIKEGEAIFIKSCAACHQNSGAGSVGPNLTDEYWLHGGGIKNVFKTIKYGVPEKGMIAWASQLRPSDMQKVSSFILTLAGTNPEGAKDPQGTIYKDEEEN